MFCDKGGAYSIIQCNPILFLPKRGPGSKKWIFGLWGYYWKSPWYSFGWPPELERCSVAPEVSIFYWFVNVKHEWMSREVIGRYKIKNIEYLPRNCRLSIPLCQIQDMQWSVSPLEVGHETTCSSFYLNVWYPTLSALFNSCFSNEFH